MGLCSVILWLICWGGWVTYSVYRHFMYLSFWHPWLPMQVNLLLHLTMQPKDYEVNDNITLHVGGRSSHEQYIHYWCLLRPYIHESYCVGVPSRNHCPGFYSGMYRLMMLTVKHQLLSHACIVFSFYPLSLAITWSWRTRCTWTEGMSIWTTWCKESPFS